MSQRFFVTSPVTSSSARLTDAEAHHLIHVMRAGPGDVVTLFDGTGAEFAASVTRVGRSEVELRIDRRLEINRELALRVHLGIALPKGDRQRWFVEKACELGVASCVPLTTRRGVAQPESGTLEKLRRAAIEAAKQCGRNQLPEIATPLPWREFLGRPAPDAIKWIAHPPMARPMSTSDSHGATAADSLAPGRNVRGAEDSSGDFSSFLSSVRHSRANGELWLAVGPEGGFDDEEVRAAVDGGWRPVGLGPRILRVETAALALLAAVSAVVEWTE